MSADLSGDVKWRAPVFVRIGYGSTEKVESPKDALHYLFHRWPHERGSLYAPAVMLCTSATKHEVSEVAAKDAFIAAAREARLLAYTK